MQGPSPVEPYPLATTQQLCFLKPIVAADNIQIGEYTYYDDPEGPERFVEHNVLYHFPSIGDRLIIGRFCVIGREARFIMNGANHAMTGLSTYPFAIFGGGWERTMSALMATPPKGDTCIGHDVWIGYRATIMPGITVGNGAIIAAHSVVTRDIPDYAIVGGNPARVIRQRFADATVAKLNELAWWNWPAEHITAALEAITEGDIDALTDYHLHHLNAD